MGVSTNFWGINRCQAWCIILGTFNSPLALITLLSSNQFSLDLTLIMIKTQECVSSTSRLRCVCLCYRIEYNSAVSRELTRLMKIPIDSYNNVLTVLQLEHYGPLLDYFDYHGRKNLAAYLITNALDNETLISTQEQVS
jgi:Vacuolar protein sorting-associated protein 35